MAGDIRNTSWAGEVPGVVAPSSNLPSTAPDPFNWAALVAQEKKNQTTKAAAKKKIKAAPKLKAATQAVAPAAPAPTAKELLDIYRAFNNGALPPDVTPEMAGLIDAGVDINTLTTANPALAQSLLSIQHQILTDPAAYDAAKAQVAAQYQNLTGDVLQSGETWMKDLYGRIVDPNDPNSALVKNDPALTGYAESMSQIKETADANQATDLAWFDKMKQNALATNQGLLAAIAAQAAVPVSGGGGGGGRGGGFRGRGRGRRGGGSGSGNLTWKTPLNTLTNQESATDTATSTTNEYAPDYYNDMMTAFANDPELQSFANRQWQLSGQGGVGPMTSKVTTDLTSAETLRDALAAQQGYYETWKKASPSYVQKAIAKLQENIPGTVIGDNPLTTDVKETSYLPESARIGMAGQPVTLTPQQVIENAKANELLKAQITPDLKKTGQFLTGTAFGRNLATLAQALTQKKISPKTDWNKRIATAVAGNLIESEQRKILEQYGAKEFSEAQKGYTKDYPFDVAAYARSGGYVPPAGKEKIAEQERNIDFFNKILDFSLPYNPNATAALTNRRLVNQGKDSSTYSSKTTNKGWTNALPGSTLDLTPSVTPDNPLTNPSGYAVSVDPISGKETLSNVDEVSPVTTGFGESRGVSLRSNLKNLLDKRAADLAQADKIKAAAQSVVRSIGSGSKTTTPVGKSRPVTAPTVNVSPVVTRPSAWDVFRPTTTASIIKGAAAATPTPKKPPPTPAKKPPVKNSFFRKIF